MPWPTTATWEASQALMVRNEASNAEKSPGKFSYPEEMKTVQETILEVAKSRSVLAAALREVGPPADCRDTAAWPTERDIVEARKNIKLAPPKGAEFGKTEVFYLNVQAEDRERSVALNEAIFKQLQTHFQELRDAKAQSMVEELTKTVALAKTDLDRATAKVESTEKRVGSDLAELRSMQDMAASDSALRRSGEEIRAQLRENVLADKTNRQLLAVLAEAQDDPGRFVAMPNRLLESHPSLRRLKDGLIDAQLHTSSLLGTMSAEHPKVLAAKESEEEIGRTLHRELAIARRGVEVELRVLADRRVLLEDQLAKTNDRLTGLAAVRAALCQRSGGSEEPRGAAGACRTEPCRGPRHPRQRQGRQPDQPHRHARRRNSSGRPQPRDDRLVRRAGRTFGGLRRRLPDRADRCGPGRPNGRGARPSFRRQRLGKIGRPRRRGVSPAAAPCTGRLSGLSGSTLDGSAASTTGVSALLHGRAPHGRLLGVRLPANVPIRLAYELEQARAVPASSEGFWPSRRSCPACRAVPVVERVRRTGVDRCAA